MMGRALALVLALALGLATAACAQPGPIGNNSLRIAPSGPGVAPSLQAYGTDANIGITLTPKGSGTVTSLGGVAATVTFTTGNCTTGQYAGTLLCNYQPVSVDMTVAGAIGHTGGYNVSMMGNFITTAAITNGAGNGSAHAGMLGKYTSTGTVQTDASLFEKAGVVGQCSSNACDAAVMATATDGDSPGAPTSVTVKALYRGSYQLGSQAGSALNYFTDMRMPAFDVYAAGSVAVADIALVQGPLIASTTVAITANVTACTYAAGTFVMTTNATGRLTLWICDGTKYQKPV